MTFDAGVPNAATSPGLLPGQNQTNMARLKTIIGADHQFNDTAVPDTDGVHKQVTYINRAAPATLPAGTNSILYAAEDTAGASQLHFYNGANDYTLTPPRVIVNEGKTALLNPGDTHVITGLPTNYVGTIFAWSEGTAFYKYYSLFNVAGQADPHEIENEAVAILLIYYSGTDLTLEASGLFPKVLHWALTLTEVVL
jgi:hypothetical protein